MIADSPLPPVERLFFALLPPRPVALGTTAWAEEILTDAWRVQRSSRLHLTLAITGDFPERSSALEERMVRAGGAVVASPFEIVLDRLSIGGRSAALRPARANAGLNALHSAIAAAMAGIGAPMREGWRFSPHMTLGYGEGRPVQCAVAARTWRADGFVLIRSLAGKTQHRLLGQWDLRETAPRQYALF